MSKEIKVGFLYREQLHPKDQLPQRLPSSAASMASDQGKSTATYRRFDKLSGRSLLYLQSELAGLQARQDALDDADVRDGIVVKDIASNWEAFRLKAAEPDNTREKVRMDLVKEIREKLKEYHEAVLLERTFLSNDVPASRFFDALLNILCSVDPVGDSLSTSSEYNGYVYKESDLSSLRKRMKEDPLRSPAKRETAEYLIPTDSLHTLVVVFNLFATFLIVLFGPILQIYDASNWPVRLTLMISYAASFALYVRYVMNAKGAEIVTSCVTYVAMVVVFITMGNANRNS